MTVENKSIIKIFQRVFKLQSKYHQNIPKDIQVTEWTRIITPTPMGSWAEVGGGGVGGDINMVYLAELIIVQQVLNLDLSLYQCIHKEIH